MDVREILYKSVGLLLGSGKEINHQQGLLSGKLIWQWQSGLAFAKEHVMVFFKSTSFLTPNHRQAGYETEIASH